MNCPLCGFANRRDIGRLCDNMKILGTSFPEGEAHLVSCGQCGLVYVDAVATQENFLSYYRHDAIAPKYYEMFGKAGTEEYYAHLLEIVRRYLVPGSALLDVAGSWGELARYFFDAGFLNVTVVDVNESCIQSAGEKGVRAKLCSSIDMGTVLDGSYDMILLNHTLEHILDLDGTMKSVRELLRDEGHVFIEVPDAEHYVDEDAAPFNFLTYEHVLHLTENDLRNLAGRYGFEILEISPYYKKVSKYPSIYAVLKKSEAGKAFPIRYSDAGATSVERYIEKSRVSLSRFLQPLRDSKEPLVLWGIGASTAILLDSFSGCNVKKLVDRNPKRQGLAFHIDGKEFTVQAPETMGDDSTIVILSIPYRESIARQIRDMGRKNRIVSLA